MQGFRIFPLVIVTTAVMTTAVTAQSPAKTFARAVTVYNAAATVRASFEQTLTNPLVGGTLKSQGELLRKKPNLVSITFAGAAKDRVVSDGETLWLYVPSSAPNQVVKLPAAGSGRMLIDPLSQILSGGGERYNFKDAGAHVIEGRATHAVSIVPKEIAESPFTQATVWVDDATATVRQLEVTEPSGVTRKIVITKLITDAAIPRSAFTFTPPPGTRIVAQQ